MWGKAFSGKGDTQIKTLWFWILPDLEMTGASLLGTSLVLCGISRPTIPGT
jgi:hypothetical protein